MIYFRLFRQKFTGYRGSVLIFATPMSNAVFLPFISTRYETLVAYLTTAAQRIVIISSRARRIGHSPLF